MRTCTYMKSTGVDTRARLRLDKATSCLGVDTNAHHFCVWEIAVLI